MLSLLTEVRDNEAPATEIIDFDKIPLIALRQTSYTVLSKLLNSSKLIPSDGGLPRDWRGISDLIGIEYRSDIFSTEDRIKKIINLWNLDKTYSDTASFGNLLKFLCEIDRWDVYEDLQSSLTEDAKIYIEKQKNNKLKAINQREISSDKFDYESESDVLTIDDVKNRRDGNPLQKYDALIIYADEDIEFVRTLVHEMENRGIKICIKERDLLGGITFEHEASMRLISERCNRLIVIISTSFYLSPANRFIVNYAQAIGIEQEGSRKIIPCIYERCKLQSPLDIYHALNYPRSIGLWNFWEKLFESLQIAPTDTDQTKFFTSPTASIAAATDVTKTKDETMNDINKNLILSQTQPIKIPRRKKLGFPNSLPSPPYTNITSNSHQSLKSDSSSITQSKNLENLDNLSIGSSAIAGSPPDLLKSNGATKKKNWYTKIFSGKNKLFKPEDSDDIKNDKIKKKGKRNFLRKLVSA